MSLLASGLAALLLAPAPSPGPVSWTDWSDWGTRSRRAAPS